MQEIIVGWKALLTIESPDWHDAVSTIIADASADGYGTREADPADYEDPEVTIDLLVVVYLAAQHQRIASEGHLELMLQDVSAGIRTILLCAIERSAAKERVSVSDVQDLLNDQGRLFGLDRYAVRHIRADQLSDSFMPHFASRRKIAVRDTSGEASLDPAIGNVGIDLDWSNYL